MKFKAFKIAGLAFLLMTSAFAAKKLYNHVISQSACNQCGDCVKECPEKAIKVTKKDGKITHEIDPALCTQCGLCIEKCPLEAIEAIEIKKPKKN